MKQQFFKYQGTGNDFVLFDNRLGQIAPTAIDFIRHCCNRRFGIGADGLMLLQNREGYDFEMLYYNADGQPSSMCGNGGRCIVAFAQKLGLIKEKAYFLAVDGPHEARLTSNNWVELQMQDVKDIEQQQDFCFLDTGSPHYVQYVEQIAAIDISAEGRRVRYNDRFAEEGTNVNFVETTPQGIRVATYERGVEGETLSCGTGVTAAALTHHLRKGGSSPIAVETKGGTLELRFNAKKEGGYTDIWLCGPATYVFEGHLSRDLLED